ncbi:MAG TPA: hypothetical protein DC046_08965 [Rhodospirillaceae bacterium]|nr:hypothetical protein [Rhodospirillaceae bacterium]|tara:strand:- start:64 stop:777 length:714 start_codon:yes stop_codon:yes gene_type:complete
MSDAIILAGGFGTRLRPLVNDRPKPLALVHGKPFLDHQLAWAAASGVERVILTVHHMADQIIEFARSRDRCPIPIEIVHEHTPLGTGGAVKNAIQAASLTGDVVIMNGDTYYNFPLRPILDSHEPGRFPITMAIAQVDNCARYGKVECTGTRVDGFSQATGDAERGLVNCGLYIVSSEIMRESPEGQFSIERDFFPGMAQRSLICAFVVHEHPPFTDIGTPESYRAFCQTITLEASQ